MIDSLIFVTIGVVLLVLLWTKSRRHDSAFIGSRLMSDECLVQLPPSRLLEQCLSEEDVRFVTTLGSKGVLQLLLWERRRLALKWLQRTRQEARRLLALHVRTVRFAADLRPATEFKLLMQAGALLFTAAVLEVLVRSYGPFRTHAYVRSIEGLGSVLAALCSGIARSISAAASTGIIPAHGE